MSTPSGCPYIITPEPKPQPPHIIPSDDESISSQNSLLPSFKSDNQPQPSTKIKSSEPSDVIIHKKSVEPISIRTLNLVYIDANNLPPIPPPSTPAPCENRNQFESLNIHCIFGCRQFRNQKHITTATNASLVNSGLLPSNIGSFDKITNPPKEKPIKKRRQFLYKVHMDIVFGEFVALGEHRYPLLLVDVATIYCWLYGLSSLSSTSITSALELFKVDAGRLPHRFHSDFNRKLIDGNTLQWILSNGSNIIAALADRQYSNGLVERTWFNIIQMAQEFITEKQVG